MAKRKHSRLTDTGMVVIQARTYPFWWWLGKFNRPRCLPSMVPGDAATDPSPSSMLSSLLCR